MNSGQNWKSLETDLFLVQIANKNTPVDVNTLWDPEQRTLLSGAHTSDLQTLCNKMRAALIS